LVDVDKTERKGNTQRRRWRNFSAQGVFLGFSGELQSLNHSQKKGSHEEHKGHKGLERSLKPGFFFVPFVPFVASVFHDVTLPFSC